MVKFSKKLHYIVKYLIIALPILLILLSYCHGAFSYGNDSIYKVSLGLLTNLEGVFRKLIEWPINASYNSLLNVLTGFTYNPNAGSIINVLSVYPLYVFWVYIFDILLDVICFIPKFIHNLFERLSD